jgi:molybdopterin-containing oxidoreductase family iron-sulfur binding subunit
MSRMPPPRFDVAEVRRRLAERRGRHFWSSLEEIVDDPEFRRWLAAEFPAAVEAASHAGRRRFLQFMGASLLLAGLGGCGESKSDLAVPYVDQPEGSVPGVPRFYATAVCFEGFAQPVLATTHAGRPTKLDGNPQHPIGGTASDAFTQAAVLQLYDPDRSQLPTRDGVPTTWAAFAHELVSLRAQWAARAGEGLRLLCGNVSSPTVIRQLQQFLATYPSARLHLFEPVAQGHRDQAMRLAFGRSVDVHYRLERCEAIVCLDDDLLGPGPRQVVHARGWSQRRGELEPGSGRVRMHVVESSPGLSGVVASHRLAADPSRIARLAVALAAELGAIGAAPPKLDARERQWLERATKDLRGHAGRSLITVGAELPAAVQALAPLINERLGNVGNTLHYTDPALFTPDHAGSLADLAQALDAGTVECLIILDSNPGYAAAAELGIADLLPRVPSTIHVGLYRDETAKLCRWHLPLAHALESWGDARALDGTVTILQPVVAPFYRVRTLPQILEMALGTIDPEAMTPVRATWEQKFGADFEARWRRALHDGFVPDTALASVAVAAREPAVSLPDVGENHVEILFRPDPSVWDGRFANVGWLQELPKPLSKLTWDNAILLSPSLAERLALANGDIVEVAVGRLTVAGPTWIMPGQAPNTVVLSLGYGRRSAGRIGDRLGYDAYSVLPADRWAATGTLRRLGGRYALATTQLHHRMEGFDFVREVTREAPALPETPQEPSLYPPWPQSTHAWGMVIDLDRCIGCNMCAAACVAENNIQVVGKEQVAIGREMHWLRVDRYYTGELENPRSYFQPVPCMHCEQAPCEMGCPVHATVHGPEGLNEMVYNRCIGTRTCSSYCPYKVRRFNWFDYRQPEDSPLHATDNPDVTVRSRGVMEKCTYCTQRIQAAHAMADKENRRIRDGEVVTACQQACPTTAIVFGDLADPQSAVSRRRRSGRHYVLLEHLGTRPRTTYLARWNDEADGDA